MPFDSRGISIGYCDGDEINAIDILWSGVKLLVQLTSLKSGSAQVQTMLVACRRFSMARISDNRPSWK